MKELNTYIIEKFKIKKDIEVTDDAVMPSSRTELIDFLDTYYEEWWKHDYGMKGKNKELFDSSYDKILKDITKATDLTIREIFINLLSVNFIKYMNKKHNLNFDFEEE